MNRKRISLRANSILVSLTLLSSLWPIQGLQVYAEGAEPKPVPKTVQQPSDTAFSTPQQEKRELIEFRSANSKRFRNPDGSFTETIYGSPVHYKDKNWNWQDINSNLESDSTGK